jgi:enamine deaminase RidA (YjgF/YER057c/UK114 family)
MIRSAIVDKSHEILKAPPQLLYVRSPLSPLVLDAGRPRNHHAVAAAAKVRCNLFGQTRDTNEGVAAFLEKMPHLIAEQRNSEIVSIWDAQMADDMNDPIRRLNPPELGTPPGYSQIVEVRGGRIIFIAGQTALNREGELIGKDDFAAQAAQVFQNLGIALKPVGCTASNLVKLTVFLRDVDNLPVYREARNRFFATTLLLCFQRECGRLASY